MDNGRSGNLSLEALTTPPDWKISIGRIPNITARTQQGVYRNRTDRWNTHLHVVRDTWTLVEQPEACSTVQHQFRQRLPGEKR